MFRTADINEKMRKLDLKGGDITCRRTATA